MSEGRGREGRGTVNGSCSFKAAKSAEIVIVMSSPRPCSAPTRRPKKTIGACANRGQVGKQASRRASRGNNEMGPSLFTGRGAYAKAIGQLGPEGSLSRTSSRDRGRRIKMATDRNGPATLLAEAFVRSLRVRNRLMLMHFWVRGGPAFQFRGKWP